MEPNIIALPIIGEGAATKIYRDGSTAVKLYENPPLNEVENEAMRQRFARNAGLPVPAVFGVRKLNGTAVALDMEYIDGNTLLHSDMNAEERKAAIHTLVILQCTVYKVNGTGITKLTDCLEWKIKRLECLSEAEKAILLTRINQLDTGATSLCHGDFHPLNLLYDGDKHWIIDWVDATAGDPLADACRTYLIFKQYMMRSAGIYLRAFCKEANVKQEDVLAWLPVVAAARLNEKLDDQSRTWLLNTVRENI